MIGGGKALIVDSLSPSSTFFADDIKYTEVHSPRFEKTLDLRVNEALSRCAKPFHEAAVNHRPPLEACSPPLSSGMMCNGWKKKRGIDSGEFCLKLLFFFFVIKFAALSTNRKLIFCCWKNGKLENKSVENKVERSLDRSCLLLIKIRIFSLIKSCRV